MLISDKGMASDESTVTPIIYLVFCKLPTPLLVLAMCKKDQDESYSRKLEGDLGSYY